MFLMILYNNFLFELKTLKPGYIEFGVVCVHSAIGIQLLLTRQVSYCLPGGLTIAEWMVSA